MSRKNRKVSAPAEVASPVLETEVVAVAAVAAAADVLDAGGTLGEAAATFEAVAAPVVPPAKRKYPKHGGKCWQVWNAMDELVAAGKAYPTVKDAREIAVQNNWNVSNASQEFYAWKKWHAIA